MSNAIPTGWSTQRLGEVVSKFQNGNAFSSSGYVEDGIPIISMGCLGLNGQFNKEYLKQKCWSRSERESLERYIVNPFDLLMAMTDVTPTMELIGRSCIAKIEQEALLNQRVGLLRIDEEKACKYFISYVTNFDDWRSYAKGSSGLGAQANLGTQQILDGAVLFPPLSEQQKIAAILTSVDDVIESTQAQINKLKDLKTGMMQELLTKGIGHTEFKDSAVGRIPKAWEVLTIGEIVESMDGGVSVNGENRPKQGNEYGVLKVSAVIKGKFRPNENKAIISSDFHRAKLNPLAGHVLFSRANTPELVGECGYVEETRKDLFLPDKLWMIKLNSSKNVDARWLSYVLSSGQTRERISEAGTGTSGSMKNISKPNLLSIKIGVPPEDEQRKISNFLLAVDKRIECCTEKLGCSANIKKALMQDLLTGKVRVNVN